MHKKQPTHTGRLFFYGFRKPCYSVSLTKSAMAFRFFSRGVSAG